MEVNFRKRTLGQLLKDPIDRGEKTLQVPQFQRKFVWGKEDEVLSLLEDFFSNIGNRYFFGPVIIRYSESDGNKVDIVDGQQRIITFTLLARALIDFLELKRFENGFSKSGYENISSFVQKFKDLILTGDVLNPVPRIRISKKINEEFSRRIIKDKNPKKFEELAKTKKGEDPAYRNIKQAYVKIFRYLDEAFQDCKDEDKFMERVNNILYSLENNQIFLLIDVIDYADAFTVFESINAKGRGLTIGDLVKNLSFKKLYDKSRDEKWLDETESFWDDLESKISNFGDFIYHMWVSMFWTCPKNKVYNNLEKEFRDMSLHQNEEFILYTMSEESDAYSIFEKPERVNNLSLPEKQADFLFEQYSILKNLRAKRCYPILLSLDFCRRENRITLQEQLSFIKKIVSLTFWYSGICENDAKRLEGEYHSIAQSLRKKKRPISEYTNIINNYFPPKDISRQNFVSKQFTNKSLIKVILYSVEDYLRPKSEVKVSTSGKAVNIEHILPLNPDKKSGWVKTFTENEHRDFKNKIGNMTLLYGPINRIVSNSDFETKKKKYKESQLYLKKEIIEADIWNQQAILDRSEDLFNYAMKIWEYPS